MASESIRVEKNYFTSGYTARDSSGNSGRGATKQLASQALQAAQSKSNSKK